MPLTNKIKESSGRAGQADDGNRLKKDNIGAWPAAHFGQGPAPKVIFDRSSTRVKRRVYEEPNLHFWLH